MNKKRVFLFWGFMDIMYLLSFIYSDLSRGRTPVYDDYILMQEVIAQYGNNAPAFLFFCSLILIFSICLSAVMFIKQAPAARLVAYLQSPLRVYLAVPSLAFIPWVSGFFSVKQAVIAWSLLLTSEGLKIWSIKRRDAGDKSSG